MARAATAPDSGPATLRLANLVAFFGQEAYPMEDLARQSCQPCAGTAEAVPESQWPSLLDELDGWRIVTEQNVPMLSKTFTFKNFVAALNFANAVGELAEAEDHHPRLIVEYGRVAVSWWTHAIGGVHRNDFIMAARTDLGRERAGA